MMPMTIAAAHQHPAPHPSYLSRTAGRAGVSLLLPANWRSLRGPVSRVVAFGFVLVQRCRGRRIVPHSDGDACGAPRGDDGSTTDESGDRGLHNGVSRDVEVDGETEIVALEAIYKEESEDARRWARPSSKRIGTRSS